MKKFALIVLTALVSTVGIFAAKGPISFTDPGDLRTYGIAGEPVITDTLLDGYMVLTGDNPTTLTLKSGTIRVDKASILSVVNTDDNDYQFYLLDGKVDVASTGYGNISVFTPWGKYFAPQPSMYTINSSNDTEKATTNTGALYNINALSNSISTIQRGETRDMLVPPRASFTNEGAFTLGTDEAYFKAGIQKPKAPDAAPSFVENTAFATPPGSFEYNQADDWMLVSGDYSYFLRNTQTEIWDDIEANRPIIMNGGLMIEDYTTGQLPALDEYIKNDVNGGVRIQEYAKIDTVGTKEGDSTPYPVEPGHIKTQKLSISVNPYITFANSILEFRLNFVVNTDASNNVITYPWQGHNFKTAANSLSTISEFISDINIENMIYLTRRRDLPIRTRNIQLLRHSADEEKLPFYLDLDLKYLRINAFATDLADINAPFNMRSLDFTIIPSPDKYPLEISLGAVYTRTTEKLESGMALFNASLKLPVIVKNDALSIGVHGGFPWFNVTSRGTFKEIWTQGFNKSAFYAGLDFSMNFGPFHGFVGVDYNQNTVLTGFMDAYSNLRYANITSTNLEGLKAVVPYLNIGVDAGYGGFELSAMAPFYVGKKISELPIESIILTDPENNYQNLFLYALNAKISAFIRPFNNNSIKLQVEYDTNKIFRDFYNQKKRPNVSLFNDPSINKYWIPTFIISSETGPVFLQGTLDFDYDKNNTLQPEFSMLLSINLGSDYLLNASYYRERKAAQEKRNSSWAPIFAIEVADDILPYKDDSGNVAFGNNFRLTPLVGVEHPIFALTLKYEFSGLSFSEFANIKSWDAGKWINSFINQFRIADILNFGSNSAFNIKTNSAVSTTSVIENLELSFDLYGIFGIRASDFGNNLSSIISSSKLYPVDIFIGYRSDKLNAYISSTITAEWTDKAGEDKLHIQLMPSANFDINLFGAHLGAFFATTIDIMQNSQGVVSVHPGIGVGKTTNWNMLAGGTLGYSSDIFTLELTGGIQINDAVYKKYDALTYIDDVEDKSYRISNYAYDEVRNKYVPFFNVALKGNASDVFTFNLDYTVNVSSKFDKLYYDRLSIGITASTSVFDIYGLLEKRGAFLGAESFKDIPNLWRNPVSRDTAFAYKLGVTLKAEHINFTVEYENEFFRSIANRQQDVSSDYMAGRLTFKSVIGLI